MKNAIELLEHILLYIKDMGLAAIRDGIEGVLAQLKAPPSFETPEQREKRTGEPWPEEAAVRALYDGKWELMEYWRAKQLEQDLMRLDKDFGVEPHKLLIVCDQGDVVPNKYWRPE